MKITIDVDLTGATAPTVATTPATASASIESGGASAPQRAGALPLSASAPVPMNAGSFRGPQVQAGAPIDPSRSSTTSSTSGPATGEVPPTPAPPVHPDHFDRILQMARSGGEFSAGPRSAR